MDMKNKGIESKNNNSITVSGTGVGLSFSAINSTTSMASYSAIGGTPVLNGLKCPKCKKELFDTNPNITLTSDPAQKNVHCSNKKCDYVGYRFA